MATLLETWRSLAYGDGLDDKKKEELWTKYFTIEKGIYEKILSDPAQVCLLYTSPSPRDA